MDKKKMSGGQKLAYFTGLMFVGLAGIITSLALKSNGIIVSGDETIMLPSGVLFVVGLFASLIASLDA